MAENSLTKLPLAGQLGVSVFLAALICGGFYYFWYADALEQEKRKTGELQELERNIRALEVTLSKREKHAPRKHGISPM